MAIIAFKNKEFDLSMIFDFFIFGTDDFLSEHRKISIKYIE